MLLFGFCRISLLQLSSSAPMTGHLHKVFFVFVRSFDAAMQTLSSVAGRHPDDLFDVFVEMRGHLYLHAGTLLLKLAQDRQQTWRSIIDLAALCYLLAYQVLAAICQCTVGYKAKQRL